MSDSKNPFAKRDGKIITIHDLTEYEKGLGCNCTCPVCDGTFIARMGEVRAWHFAHSGEPCDAAKQIVNSAYLLAKEAIIAKGYISYPSLYAFCDMSDISRSCHETCRFISYKKANYEKLFDSGKMSVKSIDIINDSNGISTAIIINDQLALRLAIDTEYCIEKNIVRYENIATIRMDIDDAIYRETTEALYSLITDKTDNKRWIYAPKFDKWVDEKEENRIKRYNEYLEKQRIEKERELERQRVEEEIAEKRRIEEHEQNSQEIQRKAAKKQGTYIQPKYKWCYMCKKQFHPDDVMFGHKTKKYYCHDCVNKGPHKWNEL